MAVAALASLVLPVALVGAVHNGLGIRPPMGWRSWNAFGRDVDMAAMEEMMDGLVVKREGGRSLRDLGFKDVGLDDNWQACGQGVHQGFHDSLGRPLVDEARFPDLRAMTAYAHARGLTAGWYANNCICSENVYTSVAEISAHYHGDVQRLVDLRFDSVKLDHCGQFNNLDRWAELLNGTGRAIMVENCHWVGLLPKYEESGELWCPFNYFRTSQDIKPSFDSMLTNLQTMSKWADIDRPISQPGCWAYPDMLEVGNLGSTEEERAHFAAWCVTSAPLILSLNLANDSLVQRIWPIVSNDEMLAVNQQWAGHPGTLVYSKAVNLEDLAPAYVWGVPCNASDLSQRGWQAQGHAGGNSLVMIAFGDSGMCVDATIRNPVYLTPCDESNPRQVFIQDPSGALRMQLPDGTLGCLEVFGKTGPGMQVTRCWAEEAPHQAFMFHQYGFGLWSDKGSDNNNQYPPRCMAMRGTYPYDMPAQYIGWQMWAKPQPGGSLAVFIVNRDEEALHPKIEFAKLKELFGTRFNYTEGDEIVIRDLYSRESVGVYTHSFSPGLLAKRDSRFYLVRRTTRVPGHILWLLAVGVWGIAFMGVMAYGLPEGNWALTCDLFQPSDKAGLEEDSSGRWTGSDSDSDSASDSGAGLEMVKPGALEAAVEDRSPEERLTSKAVSASSMRAQASMDPSQDPLTAWALQVLLVTVLWWAAAIFVKVMFKMTVHTALPPFILTCLGLEFGFLNKSLEGLSVTESTMLQNINVLFMMITAWMCDLEALSVVRICAGLLLAMGGTLQGLDSSGSKSTTEANAHIWGLVCMVISMMLTSAKWSLIQFMTQLSPPGSFLGELAKLQLAALVQPITGFVCLLLACIFERSALFNLDVLVTGSLLLRVPVIALGITLISCSELKVVELTSAVACGILINLHHIPMVMAGVITLHDSVDAQSMFGFALCIIGGIIYAYSRYRDREASEK